MAHQNTIDHYFRRFNQADGGDSTHDVTTADSDKEYFPLLRLPAEISNAIYRDLSFAYVPRLHDQPAITRVSRQLRAEALPIYYEKPVTLMVNLTKHPKDWAKSVKKAIDAFAGKSVSPDSCTLRHLTGLRLDLHATRAPGVIIMVEMMINPKDMLTRNTFLWNGFRLNRMMVGSPGLDWTDATAVAAVCHDAAKRLEEERRPLVHVMRANARQRWREDRMYRLASKPADYRAALEAMCVVASACPHLTRAVCINDNSEVSY